MVDLEASNGGEAVDAAAWVGQATVLDTRADTERSLLSSFQDEASYAGPRGDESDLEPPFADPKKRQMSSSAAVFTLLASMLGGGMLTLPYATSKVGIGTSLILSLLCALTSESTYWFLIESARATKKVSYQGIGEIILGGPGRVISTGSLVVLTLFASMGYLLLLGLLVGELLSPADEAPSKSKKNLISIIFAVILTPLSASKSLHALRYSNALSVIAAALLLMSVVFESSKQGLGFYPSKRRADEDILWFTDDLMNIVYATPFYVGAYMAHFSLLSVHSELVQPTRERLNGILRKTVFSAWFLYSTIGVMGYLYALDDTCDSIFSNLPRDWLTAIGRLGLVATLAFSYPLFIVPCRATLYEIIERRHGERSKELLSTTWMRWVTTIVLVSISAFLSCVVPSAAVFVSLTGSSVGTILSFILPSIFYLRLTGDRQTTCRWILAPFLIVIGFGVLIFSTWTALDHATDDPCNAQVR